MAEKFYNLNVRLDRNLLSNLQKEAEEEQRTLSSLVRYVLTQHVRGAHTAVPRGEVRK